MTTCFTIRVDTPAGNGRDYRMLDSAPLLSTRRTIRVRHFGVPAMRLTIALPRLLALDRAALSALPALGALTRYARSPETTAGDVDAILAGGDGEEPALPVAPLAALGAGFDPGRAYVLRADPISLVAGRDDVLLTGRVDDLDADAAAALIATLNSHFAGDGLVFHAPRPDAWFVTVREPPALATTPLACVRGAIHRHLPTGDDARRWRRWMSEMQMLLHNHPLGRAREERGQTPVTGIWLSGGGALPEGLARRLADAVFADDGPAGDVARGRARFGGRAAAAPPADFSMLPLREKTLLALKAIADPAAADAVAKTWIAPALRALERGAITTLRLLADGGGHVASWRANRPSIAMRLRNRLTRPVFAPPAFPDDDE
jgi:hypothetical protein